MKYRSIPPIVFGLSCLVFLAYVALSAGQLPDRVATHFNFAGQPDGWATRTQCIIFTVAFGIGVPLFIVTLFFAMRFFPNSAFNIQNRDYWLAPERRAATMTGILRLSFWPASLMVGFMGGIYWTILRANRQGAALPHLPMWALSVVVGCFVVGMAVWVICFVLHFRRW